MRRSCRVFVQLRLMPWTRALLMLSVARIGSKSRIVSAISSEGRNPVKTEFVETFLRLCASQKGHLRIHDQSLICSPKYVMAASQKRLNISPQKIDPKIPPKLARSHEASSDLEFPPVPNSGE
jgi:hypothetical protein